MPVCVECDPGSFCVFPHIGWVDYIYLEMLGLIQF